MNEALHTQASDSPAGISSITLIFVMLIGAIIICGLIGYVGSTIAKRGGLRAAKGEWLSGTAVLCACATVALYLWGALHLVFLEGMNIHEECAKAGGPKKAAQVDRYEGSYLPLRLVCHIDEGGSYSAAVPGYVNPAIGAFLTLAMATGAASRIRSKNDTPRRR